MSKDELIRVVKEYFNNTYPDYSGPMELIDAEKYYEGGYMDPEVKFVLLTEGNEFDIAVDGGIVRLGPCGCDLHMIQTIG